MKYNALTCNWINFQNVILVSTEEKNHFLSTADAVFRMWQFRNYEFGIGENVAWISHVLKAQQFYSKTSHSSNMPHAFFHSRIRGDKIATKGHLISEWNFGVFKSPQKVTQILDRFLPYEARAEICQNFGWLMGYLKTPKSKSEINWPLLNEEALIDQQ